MNIEVKQMKRLAVMLLALYVLAGCNTINGMGKDIKSAGEKIEDASKKK
jgi:predicted small secreted protein